METVSITDLEKAREEEKLATRQKIGRYLRSNPGTQVSRAELIEQATGVKILTPEEERRVQICADVITEMWCTDQIELTQERLFTAGSHLEQLDLKA